MKLSGNQRIISKNLYISEACVYMFVDFNSGLLLKILICNHQVAVRFRSGGTSKIKHLSHSPEWLFCFLGSV
jgi:hypothetical protein